MTGICSLNGNTPSVKCNTSGVRTFFHVKYCFRKHSASENFLFEDCREVGEPNRGVSSADFIGLEFEAFFLRW